MYFVKCRYIQLSYSESPSPWFIILHEKKGKRRLLPGYSNLNPPTDGRHAT